MLLEIVWKCTHDPLLEHQQINDYSIDGAYIGIDDAIWNHLQKYAWRTPVSSETVLTLPWTMLWEIVWRCTHDPFQDNQNLSLYMIQCLLWKLMHNPLQDHFIWHCVLAWLTQFDRETVPIRWDLASGSYQNLMQAQMNSGICIFLDMLVNFEVVFVESLPWTIAPEPTRSGY